MNPFPSERERQESDTRTVSRFFLAMVVVTIAYGVAMVSLHFLGGW